MGDFSKTYPLTKQQALQVLENVSKRSEQFAQVIAEETELVFCAVSIEAVASSVCSVLMGITDQDCFDAVNNQIFGYYCDVVDTAYELFHHIYNPYADRVDQYHDAGQHIAEMKFLKGIILGLYEYDRSPHDSFYSYIEECPYNSAMDLIDRWITHHQDNLETHTDLRTFIQGMCPLWEIKDDDFSCKGV